MCADRANQHASLCMSEWMAEWPAALTLALLPALRVWSASVTFHCAQLMLDVATLDRLMLLALPSCHPLRPSAVATLASNVALVVCLLDASARSEWIDRYQALSLLQVCLMAWSEFAYDWAAILVAIAFHPGVLAAMPVLWLLLVGQALFLRRWRIAPPRASSQRTCCSWTGSRIAQLRVAGGLALCALAAEALAISVLRSTHGPILPPLAAWASCATSCRASCSESRRRRRPWSAV